MEEEEIDRFSVEPVLIAGRFRRGIVVRFDGWFSKSHDAKRRMYSNDRRRWLTQLIVPVVAKHDGGERAAVFALPRSLPKQTRAVGQEKFAILKEPLQ